MKSEEIQKLVTDYAPVLHFHPREGEYCCYPTDAEMTYAEFGGDWTHFTKDLTPKRLEPDTPCYYETWQHEEFVQIRYWFFYKYNRFPNAPFGKGEHLSDWEHIEIRIYPDISTRDVIVWLLSNHLSARLASFPEKYTLPEFEREGAILTENHIHVWVALGSHAQYPSPDSNPYCAGLIFCDKIEDKGEVWETENNIVDLRKTNFYEFQGRWGDERAPRSPTNEYNNPWRNAPPVSPIKI